MNSIKLALLLSCVGIMPLMAKTWKVEPGVSLDEVNAWEVKPGDKVLFQRGGTWNGTLKAKSGTRNKPIFYGAYGEGAKPHFTQCVDASGTNHWRRTYIESLRGLWESTPVLSSKLDADVGLLIADSGPIMDGQTSDALFVKVDTANELTEECRFWYDAEKRRVVVRRYNTPEKILGKVRLTLAKPIVTLDGCANATFEGLALRFGGSDGFVGKNVENITIRNCDISYVGGGVSDGAKLGGGIVLDGNVRNVNLVRNRIWQSYGAAISIGRRQAGEVKAVVCQDNAIWKCMSAFHLCGAANSVASVKIEHNTCADTGLGWGCFGPYGKKARVDSRILRLDLPQNASDVTIGNNVFYRTTGIAVEKLGKGSFVLDANQYWLPNEWDSLKNNIYAEPAAELMFKHNEKNFKAFCQKTGFEKNGIFARPLFTDETRKDFRIYRTKDAIGVRGVGSIDDDQSLGDGSEYNEEKLRSKIWSLSADGKDVYVMRARARWNSPAQPGGEYAFANIVNNGGAAKLTVKIHDGRDLSNVMIQPARAPVKVKHVDAHTLELSVAAPCKFTVEPDDRRTAPLFVFINGPEVNAPDEKDPNVITFAPGIHRVPGDILNLKSGQTLYVKHGAILQAAVRAAGNNIRICGRGVIDGSIFPHSWGRKGPQYAFVNFYRCKDLLMEDVTLLGSFHWTIYPEGCDRVTIRNVKLCGDRCCNDDGIDPSNTRDLLLDNCFFRTQDDGVAIKGIDMNNGPCERLTVTNSIFWCDFARILCIGHESRAPYMNDIRFIDNDVLHYVRPLLLVEPGDDMAISNVVFRNVRIHTDTHGRTEATMRIQPVVNMYTLKKTPGLVSNVKVDNLTFTGTPIPLRFVVRSTDSSRITRNVTISNIYVNGRKMTEQSPARPKSYLDDDIWFDGEYHPDFGDPMFIRGPYVADVKFDIGKRENRACAVQPKGDTWWWKRFDAKAKAIKELGGKVDVVMLGDSITHGWDNQPALKRIRQKFSVLPLGYNGDTVKNVIWRCLNGELDGYKAKYVVVMIGTNDLGGGQLKPEQLLPAQKELLAVIRRKQPQAKIFLQALLPRDCRGREITDVWPKRIIPYNAMLKKLADGKNIEFIDFTSHYLRPDGRLRTDLFWDRLHPNPAGYEIWADELLDLLGGEKISRIRSLDGEWRFLRDNDEKVVASAVAFDDSSWEKVKVPHDWGIKGPFEPNEPGWQGKLPWRGAGWYRRNFTLSKSDAELLKKGGGKAWMEFDGVMARPEVYVNGKKVGGWDYGYMSFWLDVTDALKEGDNLVAVKASTKTHRSRWYPGGGIYRSVRLAVRPANAVRPGTFVAEAKMTNGKKATVEISYERVDGEKVSYKKEVRSPKLWSFKTPHLYKEKIAGETFRYGIRTFEFDAQKGFFLNGRREQLKGVNLHSDMGPLGMAYDRDVMKRQLLLMKEMGVNAIRTSHNAPCPHLLDLCDEMGLFVWNECFDKWEGTAGRTKDDNLEDYVDRNLRQFVNRDRNHPCVFIWSIGNEIWLNKATSSNTMGDASGMSKERIERFCKTIRDIDSSRPVAIGLCHKEAVTNDVLGALDLTGWNYGEQYNIMKKQYPDKPVLYSESASAVSEWGYYGYLLPTSKTCYGDSKLHVSSYDHSSAWWSDIPDLEFFRMERDRYCGGEFVWTGIDYLGEPTPMEYGHLVPTSMPRSVTARSSYFGIADLCGVPKDRYWLYRAHWKPELPTLHILPHWNWAGREGKKIPVYVYTDADSAELFLNGKSLGKKSKKDPAERPNILDAKYFAVCSTYRLRWFDVPYEPGELKVVAYRDGKAVGEKVMRTCGKAVAVKLTDDPHNPADASTRFVQVDLVDEKGTRDPLSMERVSFSIEGPGEIVAVGNGNPRAYDVFTDVSSHPLYYGKAVAVVRRTAPGAIKLVASCGSLTPATLEIK